MSENDSETVGVRMTRAGVMVVELLTENETLRQQCDELVALVEQVEAIASNACERGFCEWNDYMDARALRADCQAAIRKVRGQ